MNLKAKVFIIILFSLIFCLSAETSNENLTFNSWELILYRPENSEDINTIRCWLKLEDENGQDVTYTAVRSACYEWAIGDRIPVSRTEPNFFSVFKPNTTKELIKYRKTYFLSGGMAMHLNIKPGKYKISFYTPSDKTNLFECENKGEWKSNVFEYDTENPAKVLFISPTYNDNGFHNGGWIINYRLPDFYK